MNLVSITRAFGFFLLTSSIVLLVGYDDLAAAGKKEDAKQYTKDLESKDAKVRVTALTELGKLGQVQYLYVEAAIPTMFKLLKDTDAKVRVAAAIAIGMVGPEDAATVPSLVALLKTDKEESVKVAAAQALGFLGAKAKDATKDLRGAMKDVEKTSKLGKALRTSLKQINPKQD